MDIKNIFKNITPAIAVMIVGVVGAYVVYDNFFSGQVPSAAVGTIEPAAGEETLAPVTEGMGAAVDATTEAAPAAAEAVATDAAAAVAPKTDAEGCLLGDTGEKVLDEYGNCIKAVTEAVEGAAGAAVDAATDAAAGAAMEAAPAAAEAVTPAAPQ